jgi:hypothetical protein
MVKYVKYNRYFGSHLKIVNSFFFEVLDLELRAYTLSHSTSPFMMGFFRDRVSRTICLG